VGFVLRSINMANNRVAYGLAKEYGIDTTGKSPNYYIKGKNKG
jgi:hypothetical protein